MQNIVPSLMDLSLIMSDREEIKTTCNNCNVKQKNMKAPIQLECTVTVCWPSSVLTGQWPCQTCFKIFWILHLNNQIIQTAYPISILSFVWTQPLFSLVHQCTQPKKKVHFLDAPTPRMAMWHSSDQWDLSEFHWELLGHLFHRKLIQLVLDFCPFFLSLLA